MVRGTLWRFYVKQDLWSPLTSDRGSSAQRIAGVCNVLRELRESLKWITERCHVLLWQLDETASDHGLLFLIDVGPVVNQCKGFFVETIILSELEFSISLYEDPDVRPFVCWHCPCSLDRTGQPSFILEVQYCKRSDFSSFRAHERHETEMQKAAKDNHLASLPTTDPTTTPAYRADPL